MEAFIARQPIFDSKQKVAGYELLYRDGCENFAKVTDGDQATCRLLSYASTLFGLPQLTNQNTAYINMTRNLLMGDFILNINPQDVVLEILEDVEIDDAFLVRLEELRKQGYTFALDDYDGNPRFEPLIPLVDIVKVDFRLTSWSERLKIAERFQGGKIQLLAEKVETPVEAEQALKMGFSLLQGYFFEKPTILRRKLPSLATSSYGRILREIRGDDIDFDRCAEIIHTDATLTYQLMRRVYTMSYYRGNNVESLKQCLVLMGALEVRRWIILLLSRENNVIRSDELVRKAYLRGTFLARLLKLSQWRERSEDGFLLGMFSLLDQILGTPVPKIASEVNLPREVEKALIDNEGSIYTDFLHYVMIYERGNPDLQLPDLAISASELDVAKIFMECITETDDAFQYMGGSN